MINADRQYYVDFMIKDDKLYVIKNIVHFTSESEGTVFINYILRKPDEIKTGGGESMIATKVKAPQSLLVYKYDSKYDILDVFIKKIVPSVSDEIYDGIYSCYDRKTNQFVGISIMDYTTKDINKKLFIKIYK